MDKVKAYNIIKRRHPNMLIEERKILALELSKFGKEILNKIWLDEKIFLGGSLPFPPQEEKKIRVSKEIIGVNCISSVWSPPAPLVSISNGVSGVGFLFTEKYSKYIFFGHGWNTNTTFNISKNICIVMLESPITCYDEIDTDFCRELYKSTSSREYIYRVNELSKKTKNRFCMFYSKDGEITIPNMLLTKYTKYNEFCELVDIDKKIKIKVSWNIILLSELVKQLITPPGGCIFLQVYTCRNQLDIFQYNNLDAFYPPGGKHIKEFITRKSINLT